MSTFPYDQSSFLERLSQRFVVYASNWGTVVINGVNSVGDMAIFAMRILVWMVTARPKRETLMPNFYAVGVLSLPVVALTGTFIGMVLAVQSVQ